MPYRCTSTATYVATREDAWIAKPKKTAFFMDSIYSKRNIYFKECGNGLIQDMHLNIQNVKRCA